MTDAVKESVVGLGSMTDTILSKRSFDGEEASLKQVHQDDDYSKRSHVKVLAIS